ncbi:MAG: ABC transporter permease [Crocinitomicaceae bacterium]|nr:ABC transporter permease [Crocinitomicaceae bacterium]
MRDLIAIEWMKLRRLATMKVILIIYAITVPLIYFSISFLKMGPIHVIPDSAYQFPDCYNYVAYIASWFNLLIGVIIMVFTSNEIKYKTQRQNVIDGLSKRDVIFAKFAIVFIFSVIVTLYTALVGLVFGLIYSEDPSQVFNGIEQIGAYFLTTLGYLAFAFFFANVVRLQALAIILYIFSTIIESIVGFIVAQEYSQFFPLTTFSNLIPFPWEPPMLAGMQQPQNIPEQFMMGQGWSAVFAVGYIILFVSISYWVIKRRDI